MEEKCEEKRVRWKSCDDGQGEGRGGIGKRGDFGKKRERGMKRGNLIERVGFKQRYQQVDFFTQLFSQSLQTLFVLNFQRYTSHFFHLLNIQKRNKIFATYPNLQWCWRESERERVRERVGTTIQIFSPFELKVSDENEFWVFCFLFCCTVCW